MSAEPKEERKHNLKAIRILVPFSFHLLFLSRSNPIFSCSSCSSLNASCSSSTLPKGPALPLRALMFKTDPTYSHSFALHGSQLANGDFYPAPPLTQLPIQPRAPSCPHVQDSRLALLPTRWRTAGWARGGVDSGDGRGSRVGRCGWRGRGLVGVLGSV
jgi:hypothetical protein